MAYLNFNKIAPPAPNDPLVNEATQLNANWDQLDVKLQPYMIGGSITDREVGQESFDGSFNFVVFDGTSNIIPQDIPTNWSAWTNIPLASPRAIRSGFQPKWRNNPLYRMVELTGGIQFNAAADAWPLASAQLVNDDVAGAIPASMVPVGGLHIQPCAASLPADLSILVASGRILVDKPGGNTFTRIRASFLGGPGGGNFIMLDQVWWWY